jgi:hypothetical protein
MSEDHYGILEDARPLPKTIGCGGLFNKPQLLYMLLFWTAGLVFIGIVCGVPYLTYKLLPDAQSSGAAGLLGFSEERYV